MTLVMGLTEMLEQPGSVTMENMAAFVVTVARSMFKGAWTASLHGSCADEVLYEELLQWGV